MTGCKITDFCLQKSMEIVGIHSVETERKAWNGSTYMYQWFITSCCDVTTSARCTYAWAPLMNTCILSTVHVEWGSIYKQLTDATISFLVIIIITMKTLIIVRDVGNSLLWNPILFVGHKSHLLTKHCKEYKLYLLQTSISIYRHDYCSQQRIFLIHYQSILHCTCT